MSFAISATFPVPMDLIAQGGDAFNAFTIQTLPGAAPDSANRAGRDRLRYRVATETPGAVRRDPKESKP